MTVQASEVDFIFPILCFTTDGEVWSFQTQHQRMTCGHKTILSGLLLGMEMVDACGRSWRVLSVQKLGYEPFRLRHILSGLYPRLLLIDQTLESLPSPDFPVVQERVCKHMDAFPGDFCDFPDDEEQLNARKAEIRATTNMTELNQALGVDAFYE